MPLKEIPLVHNRAKELKHKCPDRTTLQAVRFGGLIQDLTEKCPTGNQNLALQHRAVVREKFLLTLWCKPEVNKLETSLRKFVALCGASLLRVTLAPPL